MASSSWALKRQAALTCGFVSSAASGNALNEHSNTLLGLLTDALTGRVWKGKEAVLQALCAVCENCKGRIESGQTPLKPLDLITLVLKECEKGDSKEYRRHAVNAVAELLKTFSFTTADAFHVCKDILAQYALLEVPEAAIVKGKAENDVREEDEGDKPRILLIKASAYKALGYLMPVSGVVAQSEAIAPIVSTLTAEVLKMPWNVRVEIMGALRIVCDRLPKPFEASSASADAMQIDSSSASSSTVLNSALAEKILHSALICLEDQKFSQVRAAAVSMLQTFVTKIKGTSVLSKEQIASLVTALHAAEKKDASLEKGIEKLLPMLQ